VFLSGKEPDVFQVELEDQVISRQFAIHIGCCPEGLNVSLLSPEDFSRLYAVNHGCHDFLNTLSEMMLSSLEYMQKNHRLTHAWQIEMERSKFRWGFGFIGMSIRKDEHQGSAKYGLKLAHQAARPLSSPVKSQTFTSPLQKRQQPEDAKLQFGSVSELHADDAETSDVRMLEAYLLDVSDSPRRMTPRRMTVKMARTEETEKVPVVSILLGDRTGPIRMDLWRGTANSYVIRSFKMLVEESGYPPLVLVRYFTLGPELLPTVSHIRRMHGTNRTQIVLPEQPSQPYIRNTQIRLRPSLCTHDMSQVLLPLIFLANVAGFVASLQEETLSQSNVPQRWFRLQNLRGQWVVCVASGRNVAHPALVENHEVVFFLHKQLQVGIPIVLDSCG
jgi:hypothetical protein